MQELLLYLLGLGFLLSLGLYLRERRHQGRSDLTAVTSRLDLLERMQERLERGVREEVAANREEGTRQSGELRQEVRLSIRNLSDSVVGSVGELSKLQEGRLNSFANQLAKSDEGFQESAKQLREEVSGRLNEASSSLVDSFARLGETQKGQLDSFSAQLAKLVESNQSGLEALRLVVEQKLTQIQHENEKKLEEMRKTVDEKLQGTLEKRLGESFRLVSDRLETVHRGLGEMQKLAEGVGDLKRVLTNVKTRGTWGEITAANLLEQILTSDQYAQGVVTRAGSGERVDFAVRLPGRDSDSEELVWLPIDAKFPKEAYERLVEASEIADSIALDAASRELEREIISCGRSISQKYLNPPTTTDFGIMFLASEGLYAEVARRAGLLDRLQREFRIVPAGPTTLAALLNSLQMGFRTLAIQKRSSEVWKVLGAVKAEFDKFGGVLEQVKKKLEQASRTIDQAGVRTRAIRRRLRDVEELPSGETARLLGAPASEPAEVDLEEEMMVGAGAPPN